MNKRLRLALTILLLTLLAVAGWFMFRPREPEYQGKMLSAWLEDLAQAFRPEDDEDDERYQARVAKATEAVRHIGTNAVPRLVALLQNKPHDSWLRSKIENLLGEQSFVEIRLPERRDNSWQAVEGFLALGPVGSPAIPALAKLLEDEESGAQAGICLGAIGAAAVPALTRAMRNANPRTQHLALETLGDIGPTAKGIAPLLIDMVHQPTNPVAGNAMRVLSEVSENPEQHLALFAQYIDHPKLAPDALYALGRLWPQGVPFILQALTNANPNIKNAAIAALQPEIRDYGRGRASSPPGYVFRYISSAFDSRSRSSAWAVNFGGPTNPWREAMMVAPNLSRCLDHTNAAVRAWVVDLLGAYGLSAIPGISRALADPADYVRNKAAAALQKLDVEIRDGGIIRGSRREKKIALVFTGHAFAEGGEKVRQELAKHEAKASLFFTGDFLRNPDFKPLVRQLFQEGHYLGPHSDNRLLYCARDDLQKTLVKRWEFRRDLSANSQDAMQFATNGTMMRFFLPPYAHYNLDIAEWSAAMGCILISHTPGTRSNADDTGEADTNFVSSQAIFDSIIKQEREDPHGLNGHILLLHLGSGPVRADKFHLRFGELLDTLGGQGYQFVRVDELLGPRRETNAPNRMAFPAR